MSVNSSDLSRGFRRREVVDFLRKKILRNGVTSSFRSMESCRSWRDVENKLGDILSDSSVSGSIKESCAWGALALAVRFVHKWKQENSENVKKFQDLLGEQKLFTNVLVGMVNRLRDVQVKERQKTQLELKQNLAALQGAEEERNLLRNHLLRVVSIQSRTRELIQEMKRSEAAKIAGMYALTNAAANVGAGEQAMISSVQSSFPAAITAPAGTGEEQNLISGQSIALYPCSVIFQVCTQSGSLIPVNLSGTSYAVQPTFTTPEAAAVPTVEDPRNSWKGKQCDTRKFFPERFDPQSGFSRTVKHIQRREGDWDCDRCNSMNFSWRKKCFKCKKILSYKRKEDSDPN